MIFYELSHPIEEGNSIVEGIFENKNIALKLKEVLDNWRYLWTVEEFECNSSLQELSKLRKFKTLKNGSFGSFWLEQFLLENEIELTPETILQE